MMVELITNNRTMTSLLLGGTLAIWLLLFQDMTLHMAVDRDMLFKNILSIFSIKFVLLYPVLTIFFSAVVYFLRLLFISFVRIRKFRWVVREIDGIATESGSNNRKHTTLIAERESLSLIFKKKVLKTYSLNDSEINQFSPGDIVFFSSRADLISPDKELVVHKDAFNLWSERKRFISLRPR